MKTQDSIDYLDPKYFVLELPLYSKINIREEEEFREFLFDRHTIDYYNPIEKTETTYEVFFNKILTLNHIFSFHSIRKENYKEYRIFDLGDLDQMLKEQLGYNIRNILKEGGFFL